MIIRIIVAFIIHTFPSSRSSRRYNLLLPPSLDTVSRPHWQCTISTPQGAFLTELPIIALQANTYITYLSHPTGSPFICTWIESSNVDKLSCRRKKVLGDTGPFLGFEPCLSQQESSEHTNIPWHLHNHICQNMGGTTSIVFMRLNFKWNLVHMTLGVNVQDMFFEFVSLGQSIARITTFYCKILVDGTTPPVLMQLKRKLVD